nr:MAG TPA: hypothetical protein [Bacteriophage sp.]
MRYIRISHQHHLLILRVYEGLNRCLRNRLT